MGGDNERGPAVPSFPSAVLMLVQAEAGLGGLEGFPNAPTPAGDRDQVMQRDPFGVPAAVERQLAGGAVGADQQPVMACVLVDGLGRGDERPVVACVPQLRVDMVGAPV